MQTIALQTQEDIAAGHLRVMIGQTITHYRIVEKLGAQHREKELSIVREKGDILGLKPTVHLESAFIEKIDLNHWLWLR